MRDRADKAGAFPHPNVKLVNGAGSANANYLHRDHLGSVRAITGPTGARVEATVYKPYGERTPLLNLAVAPEDREDKGWIGERFDPETGLQYLNARYYDPELGLFLQPDWWEVTKPGVGTNRYAYSFGDPVNKLDPGGNGALKEIGKAIADFFRGSGDNAIRGAINSVETARKRGVDDAWKMEQQLVKNGLPGTRAWSSTEIDILKAGGIPPGYVGDHITSVASDITKAADHRNIEFRTVAEHKERHKSHGGFEVPISEDRTIDRTLGGRLPDLATEGAKSWPSRSAAAIDAVLNSRTMAVIDAFDPVSIADKALRAQGQKGIFESDEDFFLRSCGSGNCF